MSSLSRAQSWPLLTPAATPISQPQPCAPNPKTPIEARRLLRRHYYPEGGWGWVIVVCCVFVHTLNHGLQLSFAVLLQPTAKRFKVSVNDTGGLYSFEVTFLIATISLACPESVFRIVGLTLFLRAVVALSRVNSLSCWAKATNLGALELKKGDCILTEVFDDCAAPFLSRTCWFIVVDQSSIIGLRQIKTNNAQATVTKWRQEDLAKYPNVKAWVKSLNPSRPNVNFFKETPDGSTKGFILGIIVALRMSGLTYHYDAKSCNGRHYVNYWIHGTTYGKWYNVRYRQMDKLCPLAATIDRSARDAHFKLLDGKNTEYAVRTTKTQSFRALSTNLG